MPRSDRSLERLPIKLILPKQGAEKPVPAGGSPAVPFRDVSARFREGLGAQVNGIQEGLASQMRRVGVVPVRVQLHRRAVAKSHRPEQLFSSTCPIIGGGSLGELFVKGTPSGLASLAQKVASDSSQRGIKALSTIESIEPVTPAFRLGGKDPIDVLRQSPRGRRGFVTKVRLFDFGSDEDQDRVVQDFRETCSSRQLDLLSAPYDRKSHIYVVDCATVDDVRALAATVGVRSIKGMPVVRALRPASGSTSPLPPDLPIKTRGATDLPVVVVVDSGVSTGHPALSSWVVGRHSTVATAFRNSYHGTFVAGLVAFPHEMNPSLEGVSPDPCGVFDLQVLPNWDPSAGLTEELSEYEFLQSLDSALRLYANRFKVWNLSLSTDGVCAMDSFSDFAVELDALQEKYQVSFVIAGGNYSGAPLLDYPRQPAQLGVGRITAPADSVLGITVGSIAHRNSLDGPGAGDPSPFSRHGAGPNYVIKPDLVHHGGTCGTTGADRSGIRSIGATGLQEDLGTSFATPLVSRTLAQIYHSITPTPSPVFARALLTHNARDPRTSLRVPDGEENFLGFGRPSIAPVCLGCEQSSSTLVFEDTLRPGFFLEWDDFPYPPSLVRNGRFFGEVWMTIAFAPARGPKWGTEYCETHIDAHFGIYKEKVDRTTGEITEKFVGLVPPEHKNAGQRYEEQQVQELRKWAPVRTYHGRLKAGGEKGTRWRLKVQLLTRHGVELQASFPSQPFSLIVTIADPTGVAPVYDEMARIVRNRFQADNLIVRNTAQIRVRR